MSTLNYIDENGNINKMGVIPQNVIDDVTKLKSAPVELCHGRNNTYSTNYPISEFRLLLAVVMQDNGGTYGTLLIPTSVLGNNIQGKMYMPSVHNQGESSVEYVDNTHLKLSRDNDWFDIYVYGVR